MGTRYPVARTARRITYKLQTHDVRTYLFEDAVSRTRGAVTRAGGILRGGVYAPPKRITRWCVNRSPHVNKKSREHFWMVSHRRIFKWDAACSVDADAHSAISGLLPPSVAVRTVHEVPGLMALHDMFQTLQSRKKADAKQDHGASEAKEESDRETKGDK